MADLLQRFSGNPFSTPVGQRIELATDPSMTSENWALNMEICDIINDTEDGARDAVRAIKKRLQQTAGKNFTAFKLTLTVLETCVKNCGKRFHVLVTNKDFVQDLVKLIGPKNDPPAEVQEKVLSLIQSWAEAFHGQPDMQGVSIVYNELRNKGIEFPKSSGEPKVPIYTPQKISPSYRAGPVASSPPKMNFQQPETSPASQSTASVVGGGFGARTIQEGNPIHLAPEQLNKLKNELEIVQGNMKVLSEMLTELKPGQEHKDDWDLLIELHRTLTTMQKRIVELIEKIANEEVTSELLRINDDLNNLFMRYERYQKKRCPGEQREGENINLLPSTSNIKSLLSSSSSSSETKSNNPPSLIDFTEETETGLAKDLEELQLNQPQKMATGFTPLPATSLQQQPVQEAMGEKEFDMFAQSRSATTSALSPPKSDSHLNDPSSVDQGQEKDMEEIERWLNTKPGEPSMSFETFLEKRASALDKQPLKNKNSQDSSLI